MANRDKQGREKKKPKKTARTPPAESRARRGSADKKEQSSEPVDQAKAATGSGE